VWVLSPIPPQPFILIISPQEAVQLLSTKNLILNVYRCSLQYLPHPFSCSLFGAPCTTCHRWNCVIFNVCQMNGNYHVKLFLRWIIKFKSQSTQWEQNTRLILHFFVCCEVKTSESFVQKGNARSDKLKLL